MSRIRGRLSYANVCATLALFVALGGSAYASGALPVGSVGTPQLQHGSVTSGKVKDGTLKAVDFASNQLLVGPKGATGATGPAGPTGTVDTTQFYNKAASDARFLHGTITVSKSGTILTGNFNTLQADCPAGYQAIGGGIDENNVFTMAITSSGPVVNGGRTLGLNGSDGQHAAATGWYGAAVNNTGSTAPFVVTAICSPIG